MAPSGFTVPAWQPLQADAPPETAGWFAGGRPWQAPQAAWVPSTLFQTGAGTVPPDPWQ